MCCFWKLSCIYVKDVIVLQHVIRTEHPKSIIVMENKKLPPKAVAALVFGILSVCPYIFIPILALNVFVLEDLFSSFGAVLTFIPSIVFAVISLVLAGRSDDVIKQNPELYRGTCMLKVARVMAYLGAFFSFAAVILIWLSAKNII